MQAAARTPNSILRKRANKENDDGAAKAAKRNRLANRRVSFAPDDELETKHIFKEDSRDHAYHDNSDRLGFASPIDNFGGAIDSQSIQQQHINGLLLHGEPQAVAPSPGAVSPLSMDLTNNSDQGATAPIPGPPGGGMRYMGITGAGLQHHQQHEGFTRNITMNVPNLSTLVEEDEEAAMELTGQLGAGDPRSADSGDQGVSPARAQMGAGAGMAGGEPRLSAPSPISPYVLREMGRGLQGGGEDDEVRNRWGFTPGADDTLEVSYGRAVMGETTYNHVYGAGTTGDLTRAIKDGQTGGQHFGQPGAVTRALAAMAANRDPPPAAAAKPAVEQVTAPLSSDRHDDMDLTPLTGQGVAAAARPTAATAAAAREAAAFASAYAGAGAGQEQPRQHHHHQQLQRDGMAAIESPKGTRPLQQGRGQQMAAPPAQLPHNTPFVENTIKLLEDDQTDAWRLQYPGQPNYDRGRLSVASNKVLPPIHRRGPSTTGGGAGETTQLLGPTTQLLATGGMHTAQLLADTTNHKAAYERFLRNMPAQQPPGAAPSSRAGGRQPLGDATAVSSSNADLRRLAAQDNTNMSLELQLHGSMQAANAGQGAQGGDLLGDGGLSLDVFALPPEPTMNLSQQHQHQQHMQGAGHGLSRQEAASVAEGYGTAGMGVAAPMQVVPRRQAVPSISCQDFLCLIDVSFNDRVCRTSYLPQSDPPPKTVAEVYEAAHVMAPHVSAYHGMMVEVSGRLANMQSRVQQLEAELSSSNPDIFTAVQVASPAMLETIKEQMIGLKKLCRIRTVRAIKQLHLNALGDLLSQLDSSRGALQGELNVMTSGLDRFKQLAEDKEKLMGAIAQRCQEQDAALEDAAQRKKRAEGLLQRLEALRAQNTQRMRRMDEHREERQRIAQSRPPKEELTQELNVLEARAAALSARSTSALTPGREGQLLQQVAQKRDELEAILGLHALRLDVSNMATTGSFSMVYCGAYEITCRHAPGNYWDVTVQRLEGAAGRPGVTRDFEAVLGSCATALSRRVPRQQLSLHLEDIVLQLRRTTRLTQQLDTCWLKLNCMQKPVVEAHGWDGQPALQLQFLNADTITKVSIRLPWQGALRADAAAPELRVAMQSTEPVEVQQAYCDALRDQVLSRLQPGTGYMPALCIAMSATLNVTPGPGTEEEVSGSEADGSAATATPGGAEKQQRVFDNPLFTANAAP